MKTIDSVPSKITRNQLRDLLLGLRIDPDSILNLTATPEFITAEVLAFNDQGKPFAVRDGGEPVVATQTIMIQIEDDDPDLFDQEEHQ